MTDFFRLFFDRIGKGTVKNESKRKAFQARKQEEDEVVNDSITLASDKNMIYGRIKGGEYDTGKYIGEIDSPENESEKLDKKKLITDDFYFLLYTPLDKNVGILLLQSYTKDNVSDIFKPFVENLFKAKKITLKATSTLFMPENMQEEFKNSSIVESFVYKNHFVINDIHEATLQSADFTITVEIKANNKSVTLNNLPAWRRKLGETILGIPNTDNRSLQTFNTKRGYIKSNVGKNNPTKFSLDANNIEIRATIYLINFITLEENGIPFWEELHDFCIDTLENDVKPEIYPEDYLNEN